MCNDRNNGIYLSGGVATIEAKFGGDRTLQNDIAYCTAVFVWPRYYGDVDYGEDNCLNHDKGEYL